MKKRNIISVPFETIICDKTFNSRELYAGIEELAASIREDGILQPIGVTRKKGPGGDNEYFLIYGFRRYMALTLIRDDMGEDAFAEVDVVLNEGNLEDFRVRNLKENIEREQLSPHEISKCIRNLVNAGFKQDEISTRLGRPQSWISLHYKVSTKLSTAARKAYEEGGLTLEQAVNIADVPEEDQNEIVDKVLDAPSRSEARKIAKGAAKDAKEEKKRTYTSTSRPTAKNLTQLVSDASFNAKGAEMVDDEKAFWNGVTAGIRLALGDQEFEKIEPDSDYTDVDYGAKKKKKKAAAAVADDADDTPVEEKPKRKRGRPRKNAELTESL